MGVGERVCLMHLRYARWVRSFPTRPEEVK